MSNHDIIRDLATWGLLNLEWRKGRYCRLWGSNSSHNGGVYSLREAILIAEAQCMRWLWQKAIDDGFTSQVRLDKDGNRWCVELMFHNYSDHEGDTPLKALHSAVKKVGGYE